MRRRGPTNLGREFVHPESGPVRLEVNIGTYARHGRHHLAQITRLVARLKAEAGAVVLNVDSANGNPFAFFR